MIHRRISSPWGRIAMLALASALAFGSAASLAEAAAPKKAAPAPAKSTVQVISVPVSEECPADDEAAMAGVRAFLDPETGELRAPTPEEAAAFSRVIASQTLLRAEPAQKVTVGPNGELVYYLGEEGMVDLIARTDGDGNAVVLCSPRSETPKALTKPLPASKKKADAKERK